MKKSRKITGQIPAISSPVKQQCARPFCFSGNKIILMQTKRFLGSSLGQNGSRYALRSPVIDETAASEGKNKLSDLYSRF